MTTQPASDLVSRSLSQGSAGVATDIRFRISKMLSSLSSQFKFNLGHFMMNHLQLSLLLNLESRKNLHVTSFHYRPFLILRVKKSHSPNLMFCKLVGSKMKEELDVILIWRFYLQGIETGIPRSKVGTITAPPQTHVSSLDTCVRGGAVISTDSSPWNSCFDSREIKSSD